MTNNIQNNKSQEVVNTIFRDIVFNEKGNFAFSPASYLEALHNVALCTNGKNFDEILNVLDIRKSDFFNYIDDYKNTLLDLETYNTILYTKEFKNAIDQNCIDTLSKYNCGSEVVLDLNDLISRINKIAEDKTHGLIKNFISPSDVDDLTAFIVLNCIFFKKQWQNEFTQKYNEEPFYGLEKSMTKFLLNEVKHNYYEDEIMDIVELPYKDSDVCCYLFVPTKNHSLFEIMNNWDENYNKINNLKQDIKVNLTVPEFKIESMLSLKDSTKLTGINNIFNWNKDWDLVDFSKLDSQAIIAIQKIIQKTYFKFDKRGTEAAAVTAFLGGLTGCSPGIPLPSKIKYIRADVPFVFTLTNKKNKDIPLFIGQVKNI